MARQSQKTKERIVQAAKELFKENGYASTSIEDIYTRARCSRATFYHHYSGKEELLMSWSLVMDSIYKEWYDNLSEGGSAFQKLLDLSELTLDTISSSFDVDSLSVIYAYHVTSKGERYFNSNTRIYNVIIQKLMQQGQESGEIRQDISVAELSKQYNILLRGNIYDWCISYGFYALKESAMRSMRLFLPQILDKGC